MFEMLFLLVFGVIGLGCAIVGIPVFITGFRAGAGLTVLIGLVLIAISIACIFLIRY